MKLTSPSPSVRACPECATPLPSAVMASMLTARRIVIPDRGVARSAIYRRRHCRACDHRWTTYELDAAALETLLAAASRSTHHEHRENP